MSVTTVYADDLSRVRVTCASAPAHADFALIERSTDGITWRTVRGGDIVPLVAGACALDDYEFAPGVLNTYRASYVDSSSPSFVAAGAGATAVNASTTPALPAGILPGDLLVLVAAIRNSGAGVPNLPAGWTALSAPGNLLVAGRRYVAGDAAPLVTYTGGVANADTTAVLLAVRNAELLPRFTPSTLLNGSAQNIGTGAFVVATGDYAMLVGWKQDDASAVTLAGATTLALVSTTTGDDSSIAAVGATVLAGSLLPAGSLVVTGGAAAISRSAAMALQRAAFVIRETGTVTPAMTRIWIKNIQRPYLNRIVTVTNWSSVERPARAGVFEIVGRSYPVAVTDLRSSRRYTLTVTTVDLDAAEDLDACLSAGEPVLVHVPGDCPVPGMYAVIGTTMIDRHSHRTLRRFHDLPLTEVAAPESVIVGTTVTWQGVINAFATWADLIAGEPTWSDVLDRIGTPTDVVVP